MAKTFINGTLVFLKKLALMVTIMVSGIAIMTSFYYILQDRNDIWGQVRNNTGKLNQIDSLIKSEANRDIIREEKVDTILSIIRRKK